MTIESKMLIGSLLLVAGLVGGLVWLSLPDSVEAGEPLVFYCAAGMRPAVEAVVKEYQKAYGVSVQMQYGGSGTLLGNIEVSRMGDLYLAADVGYVEIARRKGLTAESLPLARMQPVMVVRQGRTDIKTLDDLTRKDVRVALGNPGAAAIGRAAKQVLEKIGKWK
ncbi:hypothetical protein LCGC14_2726250, partial [marine sediment metagenome]